MLNRSFTLAAAAAAFALTLPPAAYSQATFAPNQYAQTNLVANAGSEAAVIDPNLTNPWGLSRSSNGDWWVSDAGSGLSTLYDGTTGKITPLVVTIPPADPAVRPTGSPTGTVFNGTTGFAIAPGKASTFLFATLDGTISGWNPSVDFNNAIITVNEKGASAFTGLTMAQAILNHVAADYLYAADVRKGRIAVYDANFKHATAIEDRIAKLPFPAEYAPYNVQNLGGNIYVAFVKKDANGRPEHAPGAGMVVVITPEGYPVQIFECGSFINAPWGLAIAPSDFGAFSHSVLVGNFGDGTILAFDLVTGRYKGKLEDKNAAPIVIPGLWALSVGNGTELGGPATSVFFSAGPDNEEGGVFGSLTALSNPLGNDQ